MAERTPQRPVTVTVNVGTEDGGTSVIHDGLAREVRKLTSRVEILERKLTMAESDIKKIRKAFDRIKADEAKEDADAQAYREQKEAQVADLQSQIAVLESRPSLSTEDAAELASLREELETMSPPPADPPVEGGPTDAEGPPISVEE